MYTREWISLEEVSCGPDEVKKLGIAILPVTSGCAQFRITGKGTVANRHYPGFRRFCFLISCAFVCCLLC